MKNPERPTDRQIVNVIRGLQIELNGWVDSNNVPACSKRADKIVDGLLEDMRRQKSRARAYREIQRQSHIDRRNAK